MQLKEILTEEYLKKFKVYKSASLFEPTAWDIKYYILQDKCPICYHKLYWRRDGQMAFCKSKRGDQFKITKKTYNLLTGKLST